MASIEAQQRYEHSPLGGSNEQFRVLLLHPAIDRQDRIQCQLITTSFADYEKGYEAISYIWRDPSGHLNWTDIEVNGVPYSVPGNLNAALQCLRLSSQERALWVDCICIDQANPEERSRQVSGIRHIFQRASQVRIWLGEQTETSKAAVQFIQEVCRSSHVDRLLRDPLYDAEWGAVVWFICLPWFSRIWVVQEIAVSRQATIHCGSDTLDWTNLQSCLSLFCKSKRFTDYGPINEFGASRLVDLVSQAVERDEFGACRGPLLPLETIVTKLARFHSSEPKDLIYAVLGLAADTDQWSHTERLWNFGLDTPTDEQYLILGSTSQSLEILLSTKLSSELKPLSDRQIGIVDATTILIDYSKSTEEVYTEFVCFAISQSSSLDIIFQPWALPSDRTLSSWICTRDELAFELSINQGLPKAARRGPDPLVSPPGQSPTYNASGRYKIQKGWKIPRNGSDVNSLHVLGVVIDAVSEKSEPAIEGNMPKSWLEFGEVSSGTIPEAFWHTLVAGRGPAGQDCPLYYLQALKMTLQYDFDVLDVRQLLRDNPGSIESEFWSRAQAVIWNRSLIRTEDGRLGIAPEKVQVGDRKWFTP